MIRPEEIEFKDFDSLPIRLYREAEEKVIKSVLRSLLKREPTMEDASKCTRIFKPGITDQYDLEFEGICLGQVKYNFPTIGPSESDITDKLGVEFIPIPPFNPDA